MSSARAGLGVHLSLVLVQAMFASMAVVGKLALRELAPFAVLAVRTPVAALLLLGLHALVGRERIATRDWPLLIASAATGIWANQLLFIAGLARTTATQAAIVQALAPVFVVALGVALGREPAAPRRLAGVALALGGVLWLVGADRLETGGRHLVGNLLILLNSACYAVYLVISRPLLGRYRPLTVISAIMALGALGILPFGAPALAAQAGRISSAGWLHLAYLALVPTVLAYLLNSHALARAPSSLVAVYIYLQPLLGTVFAAGVLAERPTVAVLGAALLIFAGIALVSRAGRAPA